MIQIVGKTGMLGTQVMNIAESIGMSIDNTHIDVVSVRPDDIKADIVINCSGVFSASDGRDKLVSVNRFGPKNLAAACDEAGARLVHISTDAVFDEPGPHNERDHCSPSTAYGRTKMQGEIKYGPHLTVRASFIGFGRRGIVNQIAYTNDIVSASNMFLWSGHTVYAIADVLITLAVDKGICGLMHIPGEFQTRYELVNKLVDAFDLSRDRIVRDDSYITDRRLVSLRWNAIGLPNPPAFEVQLEQLSNQYRNTCRPKATSPTVASGDMGEHSNSITTSE